MHCLLYIQLDGFYLAGLREVAERTLVVTREREVLDASPLALARGVRCSMSVGEARAILAGDGEFLPWEADAYRSEQTRWLELCADFTDVIEPIDQHCAFADLSQHGLPLPLVERLRNRLSAEGFHPRLGVAGSRWVAREAAMSEDASHTTLLTPRRFVAPLPISHMPISDEQARHLVRLGYRTIGDVAQLPIDVLRTQFDAAAYEIARFAQGGGDAEVAALFPADSVAARTAFECCPETEEALRAGVDDVARVLAERLIARERVGRRLEVAFEYEDGSIERRGRTFSRPFATAREICEATGRLLTPIPETPISALLLRMPQLEPAERVQLEIDGSRGDRERGAAAALQHVRAVFGDSSVQVAGEVAEPRWKLVRRAFSAANGWAWV